MLSHERFSRVGWALRGLDLARGSENAKNGAATRCAAETAALMPDESANDSPAISTSKSSWAGSVAEPSIELRIKDFADLCVQLVGDYDDRPGSIPVGVDSKRSTERKRDGSGLIQVSEKLQRLFSMKGLGIIVRTFPDLETAKPALS